MMSWPRTSTHRSQLSVLHLAFGHLEHLLEGCHLIGSDEAIRLGHLGAERNHADGKGNLMFGHTIVIAVEGVTPGKASKQPTDGAAFGDMRARGKPSRGACQFCPDQPRSPLPCGFLAYFRMHLSRLVQSRAQFGVLFW